MERMGVKDSSHDSKILKLCIGPGLLGGVKGNCFAGQDASVALVFLRFHEQKGEVSEET